MDPDHAVESNRRINVQESDDKTAQPSDDPVQIQINGSKLYRRDKRRVKRVLGAQAPCSSSSSATGTQNSPQRGLRVAYKRRNPRFFVRRRASEVEAIAFPLGMSIAAVVAQVLERTDPTWKEMPVDNLSMICTSAVRESLFDVFGDKFEPFARNFEKAFGSTLKTLRLVKGSSSVENPEDHLNHFRLKDNSSWRSSNDNACQKEFKRFDTNDLQSFIPTVIPQEESSIVEDIQENQPTVAREISLHASMHRELSCVPSILDSRNNSTISTFEKYVEEQSRANDLKAFEIGLTMRKLHLKETQLTLNSDSNFLERCKLSMGLSKASFQAEKFKTKMEDTRNAELIRNCIDCLVAGLFFMSALIIYGTYVYSYKRIMEATSSCNPSTESSSWWAIPKPMASFNSGLQTLKCQVQVISRMLFGILIILAIGYSIFQRAAAPKQTMPVTFILVLLGVGCGIAGKLCIDTLGGSGYHWLVYWELLCSLHFLVHMFTSFIFALLYGPIKVSQGGANGSVVFPYWMRRVLFYLLLLLVLPVLSGLLPFASLGEWKNHVFSLVSNLLLAAQNGD
ncbi:hypothetical protein V2J09_002275 [Rumex salicifolius]